MSLLSRINVLRSQHGNVSINRLEKECGLTRGSMAKWDDHTPSADKILRVANYFGISPGELMGAPSIPPQGAKKAPTEISERELDMSAKDLTALQKDAVNYVLSLSPEKLSIFLKLGRAAFDEDVKDD